MAELTYENAMEALRNADSAGDADAARRFAEIASRLKPEASKYDPNVSAIGYQINRFNKGGANILSLPAEVVFSLADITKQGLSQIPGYREHVADPLNRLAPNFTLNRPSRVIAGALSDPSMKAPSRQQEILGGVSEFAGAGLLPSSAVISRAPHLAPAIASEIGATVLGGVGSETMGLPGAIVGSVVGANTPLMLSKAYSGVSSVLPWVKGRYAAQAPAELNAAISANPSSQANIAASDQITKAMEALGAGTFRPTLGGQTGAPGIIAREHQIARSSPEDLSKYAARASENKQVIDRASDLAFPASGDIQRTAGDINRRTIAALNGRLDEINKARVALEARLARSPQQEVGAELVRLRNQAEEVAKDISSKMIQDVYTAADKAGLKIDMSDIVNAANKVRTADQNTFQNLPPVFKKIAAEYGPKEVELTGRSIPPDLMAASQQQVKQASFKELHSLWKQANDEFGVAMRAGDNQAIYFLNQVKTALKSKRDAIEQGGFGEVTSKFREFNKFYNTKYAPAFIEGVGGKIDATNRYGDVVKAEDVVSKFFNPSGLDDFNRIFGGDKKAQTTLTDGIVGMFREAAVREGKIDPRLARDFLRQNEEALKKVPDIAAILNNPVARNAALIESAGRLKQSIADVNKSFVAKFAKTDNVDAVVDRALTDRQTLANLVAIGREGGQKYADSLARMIADRLPEVAARQKVDPLTFIGQHESTLKPMLDRLGPNHFENLKTISGAKTIMGRTDVPKMVNETKLGDVVESVTGSTPRTIWAQSTNAAAGRQSYTSGVLHLLSRFGIKVREDQAEAMMRAAIYEPAIASTWAKMAEGKRVSIQEANSFKDHLFASGIRIIGSEENK